MAVQQTECYRVVTIGYLKNFIGDLIQNSSNGSVIHISRTDDTYCPTYSELTGGTIIQTWSQGSTPNGDRDGIVVSSSAILGGNYASNQLVDQKDLSLMYTRFKSFGISANPTTISECGGNSTLSYSHVYTRYNKYMNDSCATASTSSDVGDTSNGEVSWSPGSYGSISYPTYSIGKNGSVSAPARSTTVTGSITFRGTSHSDTLVITQNALTGGYSQYVTYYTVTTSVGASPSSSQSFGCDGGTYSATGTRYYDTYYRYSWTDSCGENYPSLTSDTKVSSGSESMGSKSGSFSYWDCCNGGYTDSASLSFSQDGYSDSVSFSQSCADCSSDPSCSPEPPHEPDKYRGTDNGSDYIDGQWYSHPINIGWKGGGPDVDDSICVDTLYINGVDIKSAGSYQVNDWWTIEYHSGGSFGKGYLAHVMTQNNSSSPRTAKVYMTTDDTGNLEVGPHAGLPVAPDWEYEAKQAPEDHYWYGDHSYTTQPVPCGTGPCPGTEDEEGCYATIDCATTPPPPPETGSCEQLSVSMSLDCNQSTGKRYLSFTVGNWYTGCTSMTFMTELKYTNSEGYQAVASFGDVVFTGNGTFRSMEVYINPDLSALTGAAKCTWYGDFSVEFINTVAVRRC